MRSVQLLAVCAWCLAGIGVLAARRHGDGRPRRRSVALLVDSFAVGLVMIALLLRLRRLRVAGLRDDPARDVLRHRARAGRLPDRPARRPAGPLGRRRPAGRAARRPAARRAARRARPHAARPVAAARLLAARIRRRTATSTARPSTCPRTGRATTLIERDGRRVAALVHDPALSDEPELLEAVSAAAGFALENARLQAELRARLEELQGSRGRVHRGRPARAPAARAQPARRRPAAARRAVAVARPARRRSSATTRRAKARLAQARQEVAASLQELRDLARGIHPAVVSGHGLRGRARVAGRERAGAGRGSTSSSTSGSPETLEVAAYYVVARASRTSASTRRRRRRRSTSRAPTAQLVVEVVDDGVGGADTESGLRPARAGRPRRGARRPPAGLDAARWRDAGAGGDAVRVAIAEDSVLLREGVARLLARRASTSSRKCATPTT